MARFTYLGFCAAVLMIAGVGSGCKSMVGTRPAARANAAPPAPAPVADAAVPDSGKAPATEPTATGTGAATGTGTGTGTTNKPAPPVSPAQFEQAAMAYAFVDGKTGRSIDTPTALAQLASQQLVCLGEEHPNPHHHWAQREIVKHLSVGAVPGSVALGLEMVQTPFQGVLDDFEAGTIDAPTFLSRSGWNTRWGYDFGLYQPIMAAAIAGKIKLLALNAPRELTKRIVRDGMEALTAEEKSQLPPIVALPAHEAWFWQQMMGMGHPTGEGGDASGKAGTQARAQRYYQVQEVWDEAMAEVAARWLRLDKHRRIIVLAGSGHCHALGVPARAARRGIKKLATVRPIVDASDDAIADEISSRQYDYLMILRK